MRAIDIPISGTFDANGGTVFESNVIASFWSAVTVAVDVSDKSSSPSWSVYVRATPRLFSDGPGTSLGPFPVSPNGKIKITAFGGTPNTSWVGSIWGIQSEKPDGTDIFAIYQAQSYVGNQQTSSRINITTQIVASSAQGTFSVTVANAKQFQIGDSIIVNTNPGPTQQSFGPFFIDGITRNANGTWTVTVEQPLGAAANPGDNITFIPTIQVAFFDTVPVSFVNPSSAIVSLGSALAGNTTSTLLAGIAAKTIKIFSSYMFSSAATFLHLQDGLGTRLIGGNTVVANTIAWGPMDSRGVPCGVGQPLQLTNDTATATNFTGTVDVSQA